MRSSRKRLALAAALTALGVASLLAFTDFPLNPDADRPVAATKIADRNGNLLYEVVGASGGRHTDLPLEGFAPALIAATIATEDAGFYRNVGVDPVAILRAARTNWAAGGPAAGGSTITQQVARTVFLSPEERADRSLARKAKEAALALRLSQRYGKDRILALYLNRTYYGNLAYGAEAAAQTYFGKPARELDLA